MKTVRQFTEELQRISENKQDLPIVVIAPNGEEIRPSIKMKFKEGSIFTPNAEIERIVIHWD